jgi:hypothetical protein
MAHYPTGDGKYRGLSYDDDHRSSLGSYRFGSARGKRVGARTVLSRVNGYLKNMIEAIASSKLRRMERELELRGIRYDRPNGSLVARKSQPSGRSR